MTMLTYADAMSMARGTGRPLRLRAHDELEWYFTEGERLFDMSAMQIGEAGGSSGADIADFRHVHYSKYLTVRTAMQVLSVRHQRTLRVRWQAELTFEGRLPGTVFAKASEVGEFGLIAHALKIQGTSKEEKRLRARLLFTQAVNAYVEARWP